MADVADFFEDDQPLHLQQLRHITSALQGLQIDSDAVTWVPQTVPEFVKKAVQQGLRVVADNNGAIDISTQPGEVTADEMGNAERNSTIDAAVTAGTLDEGPVVIAGSQHIRAGSPSSKRTDWIITICLVPDGLPTAEAADVDGGLAVMEVVTRLVVLQDCQPVAAPPELVKAFEKVKWQQYGLKFSNFHSSTSNEDPTGILTLSVLPDAVVTPFTLVVCSMDHIMAFAGLPAEDASNGTAGAAQATTAAVSQPHTAITSTSPLGGQPDPSSNRASILPDPQQRPAKLRKLNPARQPPKPAALSQRRQVVMFVAAFEQAFAALKARLPTGYLMGKLEGLVTACLPSIAASLSNIVMRAANPQLCQLSCETLSCVPEQLRDHLLARLQTAANGALAAKAAAANKQQQQLELGQAGDCSKGRDTRQMRAARAAAAAIAAAAGDGIDVAEQADGEHLAADAEVDIANACRRGNGDSDDVVAANTASTTMHDKGAGSKHVLQTEGQIGTNPVAEHDQHVHSDWHQPRPFQLQQVDQWGCGLQSSPPLQEGRLVMDGVGNDQQQQAQQPGQQWQQQQHHRPVALGVGLAPAATGAAWDDRDEEYDQLQKKLGLAPEQPQAPLHHHQQQYQSQTVQQHTWDKWQRDNAYELLQQQQQHDQLDHMPAARRSHGSRQLPWEVILPDSITYCLPQQVWTHSTAEAPPAAAAAASCDAAAGQLGGFAGARGADVSQPPAVGGCSSGSAGTKSQLWLQSSGSRRAIAAVVVPRRRVSGSAAAALF